MLSFIYLRFLRLKESFNFDQVVNYLTKPMERDKVNSLLKSVISQ